MAATGAIQRPMLRLDNGKMPRKLSSELATACCRGHHVRQYMAGREEAIIVLLSDAFCLV